MQEQVGPMFDDMPQTWTELLVHDTLVEVYKQVGYRKLTCRPGSDTRGWLFLRFFFPFSVNSYCPQVQTVIFQNE